MAKYKYTIMRTDQERSISVETDEPLPHIAIGNRLIVANAHVSQDGGTFLKIRDIEMTLAAHPALEMRVVQIVIYAEPAANL